MATKFQLKFLTHYIVKHIKLTFNEFFKTLYSELVCSFKIAMNN